MQMLIVQTPEGENRVFDLYGDDVTIGRERGHDMQLAHASVSRDHAQVAWRSGGYVVIDSGSHNGVYVNGQRVDEPVALKTGDLIRLGRFELIYITGEVPARFKKLNVAALDRWYTVDMQAGSDSTHHLTTSQMKRLLAARVLLLWTALGFDISWAKSQFGVEVSWIGASLRAETGLAHGVVTLP